MSKSRRPKNTIVGNCAARLHYNLMDVDQFAFNYAFARGLWGDDDKKYKKNYFDYNDHYSSIYFRVKFPVTGKPLEQISVAECLKEDDEYVPEYLAFIRGLAKQAGQEKEAEFGFERTRKLFDGCILVPLLCIQYEFTSRWDFISPEMTDEKWRSCGVIPFDEFSQKLDNLIYHVIGKVVENNDKRRVLLTGDMKWLHPESPLLQHGTAIDLGEGDNAIKGEGDNAIKGGGDNQ